MIKISIITVTYNSIQYLAETIQSMRDQTYLNVEYIVIDGGSTDGTLKYLYESKQFDQIVSEKDGGIYDALNKGLKLASGDIIGILHSNDLFASDQTLQEIRNAFSSGKKKDIVYGDLDYTEADNTNHILRSWVSQSFKPGLIQRGWMAPHPTLFIRREVYEKHGFYNIKYKISADYDYMIRLFQDVMLTTFYLPKVLSKMRKGGVSNTGINNLITKSKEDYLIIKHHKISFPLWVLFLKNITKLPQLFLRNQNNIKSNLQTNHSQTYSNIPSVKVSHQLLGS